MIAHEHVGVGVHSDVMFVRGAKQQLVIVRAVLLVGEDGAANDAARDDVERDAGQFESTLVWHGASALD